MNAAVQPETSYRIVHVSRITGQEHPALLEAGRDALMNGVDIAMDDFIASGLGKEFLQPRLGRRLAHDLLVALTRQRRENGSPCSVAIDARDFEEICPFIRIRKIGTERDTMGLREIKQRRQHKKA